TKPNRSVDDGVVQEAERQVEVLDRLDEPPAVVERLGDVLLEEGSLLGIAPLAVELHVEPRRFLEEVQRFTRRGCARRIGAGAKEKRLGALGRLSLAV